MCLAGSGASGQLGNNATLTKSAPTASTVPAAVSSGWAAVAAGYSHTCGIAAVTAMLYCFGEW